MPTLTQADRHIRVNTPLGEDVLLLESLEGTEGMSVLFNFQLGVLAESPVDLAGLLKKPVVASIRLRDDSDRSIHGLVSLAEELDVREDRLIRYRLEVVPWLWFLSLFQDSRIFQNMNIPAIVKKVFTDRGFPDFEDKTIGTYPVLEYCVQYRETDLNFVSRLLEHEGIFYYFEHSADKHTLILADDSTSLSACPSQATAAFDTVPGAWQDEDVVLSLSLLHRSRVGKFTVKDYDFTKPNTTLESNLVAANRDGEFFEYPAKYSAVSDGSHYSTIRMEEQEVLLSTSRGSSNIRALVSGYKFTVSGHSNTAANIAWTVVRISQKAAQNFYRSGNVPDPNEFDFHNEFEAIPNATPFRPPRLTRKPFMQGSQTAVVSGKSGEEIWTDQYGRIKVQFFWDREGKADENSSCWVRVSQSWAGKGWGAIYLPRIGQEVIVDFLEGDPDQPIITGRVYNADQTVPYTLPDEQTKSTLKSMSSKGGNGFNEFRFEDKAGSEQIFLYGQKDLHINIQHDRRENIGNDRNLEVTRDKLEKIGRDINIHGARDQMVHLERDHHVTIDGKQAIKVTGSHSMEVDGDVIETFKGNHTSQVTSSLYIKAMNIVIEAATDLTLKVGGNFIDINSSGVYIFGSMVFINSGGSAGVGAPGSLVSPVSPGDPQPADTSNPGQVTSTQADPEALVTSSALNTNAIPGASGGASDAPTHNPNSPENQSKKHWIEIKLIDEDGKPVPGEVYKITLPDGSTIADGTLDDKGMARVDNIDPGTCQVTFPNLDKEAWEPK